MYKECLKIAGAQVYEYENFGSYQGDWLALVEIKGLKGWIQGAFGSCSGCDAFQAEFGGSSHDDPIVPGDWHMVDEALAHPTCPVCVKNVERLKEFGQDYLDDVMTQAEAEKHCQKHAEWDMEVPKMLEFVKSMGQKWRVA